MRRGLPVTTLAIMRRVSRRSLLAGILGAGVAAGIRPRRPANARLQQEDGNTDPASTPARPVTYFLPQGGRPWGRVPEVVVAGPPGDPRIVLTIEAVEYWNGVFAEVGTPFRLGAVTQVAEVVPDAYLLQRSAALLGEGPLPPVPEAVRDMPGDVIVALSDASFVSFTARLPEGRILLGIRGLRTGPFRLPNVARNVIAHELGHAIGLGHNDDATTLMCGRPASCRPDAFQDAEERYFPLTAEEKARLLRLYPADWAPAG